MVDIVIFYVSVIGVLFLLALLSRVSSGFRSIMIGALLGVLIFLVVPLAITFISNYNLFVVKYRIDRNKFFSELPRYTYTPVINFYRKLIKRS